MSACHFAFGYESAKENADNGVLPVSVTDADEGSSSDSDTLPPPDDFIARHGGTFGMEMKTPEAAGQEEKYLNPDYEAYEARLKTVCEEIKSTACHQLLSHSPT